MFEGGEGKSTPWEFFADRFNRAAQLGGWDPDFRAAKLLGSLGGSACNTVSSLGPDAAYDELMSCLEERYSARSMESMYDIQLRKRLRQVDKETPVAYLDDIQRLCRYAFPRASAADRRMNVMKFFVMGHPPAYRNHLNASVDRFTQDTAALLRACGQYEQTQLEQQLIPATKPVMRVRESNTRCGGSDTTTSDESEAALCGRVQRSSSRPKGSSRKKQEAGGKTRASRRAPKPTDQNTTLPVTQDQIMYLAGVLEQVRSDSARSATSGSESCFGGLMALGLQAAGRGGRGGEARRWPYPAPAGGRGPKPAQVRKCYYCLKPGHFVRECMKYTQDEQNKRIEWPPATIQRVAVLLDREQPDEPGLGGDRGGPYTQVLALEAADRASDGVLALISPEPGN